MRAAKLVIVATDSEVLMGLGCGPPGGGGGERSLLVVSLAVALAADATAPEVLAADVGEPADAVDLAPFAALKPTSPVEAEVPGGTGTGALLLLPLAGLGAPRATGVGGVGGSLRPGAETDSLGLENELGARADDVGEGGSL